MSRTPVKKRKLNRLKLLTVSEYNQDERRYMDFDTSDTLNSSNFSSSFKRFSILRNNETKFYSSDRNNNDDFINSKHEPTNNNDDDNDDNSNYEDNTFIKNCSNDEDSSLDDNNSSGDYSDYSSNISEINDNMDLSSLNTKSTSNEIHYKCNVLRCEKSFTSFDSLAKHKRIHNNKRRIHEHNKSKPVCKKKFKRSAKRKIGEKTYECNEPGCEKKYTSLSSLKVHRRIHTNEKPYKCVELGCNEVFRSLYFLRLHSKKLNHRGYSYTKYNN